MFEARERAIKGFARETKFAGDILKLAFQSHRPFRPGVKIKIQHHAIFGRADLHQFESLPGLDHLMGHELYERESARWVGVERLQDRGFGINAHP